MTHWKDEARESFMSAAGAGGAAFRVFMVLVQHAHRQTRHVWLDQDRIAQRSHTATRLTVREAMTELAAAGWIERDGSVGRAHRFKVLSKPAVEHDPIAKRWGQPLTPQGVSDCSSKGSMVDPVDECDLGPDGSSRGQFLTRKGSVVDPDPSEKKEDQIRTPPRRGSPTLPDSTLPDSDPDPEAGKGSEGSPEGDPEAPAALASGTAAPVANHSALSAGAVESVAAQARRLAAMAADPAALAEYKREAYAKFGPPALTQPEAPAPPAPLPAGATFDPSDGDAGVRAAPTRPSPLPGAPPALADSAPPFQLELGPADAPPPPKVRAPRAKKPKKAKEEKADYAYAKAYAQGQIDAGATAFAPPLATQPLKLAGIHHAKRDGTALAGDDLLEWFRTTSAEYRVARIAVVNFEDGLSPFKFLAWLNAGRPAAVAAKRRLALQQEEGPDGPLYEECDWSSNG